MTKKRFTVGLQVTFFREGEMFVAFCPALDLSTCGPTFDAAKANFQEALVIFFEECVRHDTTDRALDELGWHKTTGKSPQWQPPIRVGEEVIPVEVPVPA